MLKKLIGGIALILLILHTYAQTPDMYPPPDPEPVEITPLNIVLYVVLPIILIVGFIFYRRSVKKNRRK